MGTCFAFDRGGIVTGLAVHLCLRLQLMYKSLSLRRESYLFVKQVMPKLADQMRPAVKKLLTT